ncbi:hypothetical protein JTB14_028273, partial [Gonioctena quinquepunctata]
NREIYDTLLQENVSEEDLMLEIDCCEGYEKKFIDLRITYGNRQKHVDIGLDEDDRRSRASLAVSKSTLGPVPGAQSENNGGANPESSTMSRLESLMSFVKSEVENEERISLAAEGFGLNSVKRQGSLSATEVENAEKFIYKIVQLECFGDGNHQNIKPLNSFKDETRISGREDERNPENITEVVILATSEISYVKNEFDLLESSDEDFVLDSESRGEDVDLVDQEKVPELTAYGIIAQPLTPGAPTFCLSVSGTDNAFMNERSGMLVIYMETKAEHFGIRIVRFLSDGVTRLLKAMRLQYGLPSGLPLSKLDQAENDNIVRETPRDWFKINLGAKLFLYFNKTAYSTIETDIILIATADHIHKLSMMFPKMNLLHPT